MQRTSQRTTQNAEPTMQNNPGPTNGRPTFYIPHIPILFCSCEKSLLATETRRTPRQDRPSGFISHFQLSVLRFAFPHPALPVSSVPSVPSSISSFQLSVLHFALPLPIPPPTPVQWSPCPSGQTERSRQEKEPRMTRKARIGPRSMGILPMVFPVGKIQTTGRKEPRMRRMARIGPRSMGILPMVFPVGKTQSTGKMPVPLPARLATAGRVQLCESWARTSEALPRRVCW